MTPPRGFDAREEDARDELLDEQDDRVGPFHFVSDDGFEAWGFAFPSGYTVLEWDQTTVPDRYGSIDKHHQSLYHSVEDFRTVCDGRVDWGASPEQFDEEEGDE
jgi:hypothetical protein